MANETNKTEAATITELEESIANLPRTDHMTLPAIMVTTIDAETAARMEEISDINKGGNPDTVVGDSGKTLQQVHNQFEFGVTDLNETGAKHTFAAADGGGVKITAPAINDEVPAEVVIVPTPANIAPVDAEAPKNPVEARVAEGKAEDGSEGEASTLAPVFTPAVVVEEESPAVSYDSVYTSKKTNKEG